MSATPSPGSISLGPSRTLAAWIACSSLSAVGVSLLYLPVAAAVGAGCLMLLDAWQALQRHALRRHQDAIVAIEFREGELYYQVRSGTWRSGIVSSGGMVTRWLTVVRVRDGNAPRRRRAVVLCADALSAEDFRRLRIYLRWRWHEPTPKLNARV